MTDKNTCYIERSKVREILCCVADEHVHIAETLLMDVDALPIVTAADISNAEWVEFCRKYRPTIDELMELVRRFSAAAITAGDRDA